MNIVIADPDLEEQRLLSELLHKQYGGVNVTCFTDPLMAVKFGANNFIDALYTVPSMKRLSGFELGKLLRSLQPDLRLLFIADDDRQRTDAMRILADGYLVRPLTAEKLRQTDDTEW